MFLDLPAELLEEIAFRISSWHRWTKRRWSARAVCRLLQDIIDPHFFSTEPVIIGSRSCEPGLYGNISFLAALASGTTGWSRYTKELRIEGVDQKRLTDAAKEEISRFLPSALESLGALRTVIWHEGNGIDNPPIFTTTIIKFLDSLKYLDALELLHLGRRVLTLPHLSGMRSLKLIDPAYGQALTGTLLAPVVQVIQHSRTLSCLNLPNWDIISPELWDTLRRERICLAELHANDGANNSLLAYLDSYAGLKHLILPRLDHGQGISEANVERFFNRILPRHAESLETLVCTSELEGLWSFESRSSATIVKLRKLLRIQMTVNLAEIAGPSTEFHKNPVELFIDVASQLPSLRALSLLCANPVGSNGLPLSSSVARHRHRNSVRRQITTILAIYGPTVVAPAVARWVESPRQRRCCLRPMADCRC